MELPLAIETIEEKILTGARHPDYQRVVDLAIKYKALLTGENAEVLLKQFIKREDDEMFKQRVALTQLITPALCAGVTKPFFKVSRNSHVTKRLDVKDAEGRAEAVQEMLDKFYGDGTDENGLDYYLQTRFNELTFSDPNCWVLVAWDNFDNKTQFPAPRPLEVSAAEAIDFSVVNEVTQWLLVMNAIKVPRLNNVVAGNIFQFGKPVPITSLTLSQRLTHVRYNEGFRYTLFTDTVAISYEEVDLDYVRQFGIPEGAELVSLDPTRPKETSFLRRVFVPNIGYVQARRVGYARDIFTNGRTYVSPLHPAMPYLMKSVKTVSELDLTMALLAFPQKFQYVQRCRGSIDQPCNNGKCLDQSPCPVCSGTGWKIPTTAQDAIVLPMPQDREDMIDLSKLIYYAGPPVELIKFQSEYVDSFEPKVQKAVFNSDVFVRATIAKTATEKELEYENVYDTLLPFSKQYSTLYKFIARICFILADVTDTEAKVVHSFPGDFKLKTVGLLVSELQTMNESGAPDFVRSTVSDDLAEIIYQEDDTGLLRYKTQKSFFPFPGKNTEEITLLMDSLFVTEYKKVLYANFEALFQEIEREDKMFYLKTYEAQDKVIKAKVKLIMDDLEQGKVDRVEQAQTAFKEGGTGSFRNEAGRAGATKQGGAQTQAAQQEQEQEEVAA